METLIAARLIQGVGGDLGEASGINDAAARVGSVVVIALVPALIGAGAASTPGDALANGYQPAMLALAALAASSAVIAAVFVTDHRASAPEDQPVSAVSEPVT